MITYSESEAEGKPKATLIIDNGDLQGIKNAMEQYSFINQEALLRYALLALLTSSDNKLYIKNSSDNLVAMNINENLIRKEESK